MNSNQRNVFIEDHEENQSFEQPCDRKLPYGEDDSDNSEFQKINNEEIDQLLDDDNLNNEQIVLKFKVKQLQKICNTLTSTNRRLIKKVTTLEQQRQSNQKKQEDFFVDEYSQLNGQFTQVQSLIRQYKQSLDQFQKNTLADMKAKQQKILKLKSQVKVLKQKNAQLQLQKQDIQKINKQLQTRNQGLILQIQNIEKQKSRLQQKLNTKSQYYQHQHQHQHHNSRYDSHHNHLEYELPSQIQNQYELLIQKLVKQLEYQKNIKKKMNEQIKRMSQQLMESQKQIMSKNKKLYQIQMKLLKSSKTTADSSVNYSKLKAEDMRGNYSSRHQEGSQKSNIKTEKEQQKFNFKTFALLSVINGQLDQQITNAQRKIIGIKVIEFYERKIQRQDFSNVMPQNLLVTNFSHKKPDILSIRKVGTSVYEEGQKTEQSLVWNLAFIVDNLFGQIQGVQDFDEILSLTGQVLQKQIQNNKEILQALKQTLYN